MKKIGLIILVLVIALGSLGAGYAYWSQSLTVTGTVNAGNLAATIVGTGSNDSLGANMGASIVVTPGTATPIGSANCSATINNIYPGYTGTATMTITNTGSLPIKVVTGNFVVGATSDATLAAAIAPCVTFSGYAGEVIAPLASKTMIMSVVIPPTGGVGNYWDGAGPAAGKTVTGTYSVTVKQANQ